MENIIAMPGLGAAVHYLSGFLFVLLVLFLLWLVIDVLGILFFRQKKKAAALSGAEDIASTFPSSAGKPDQIPEDHLVAIAAAVTVIINCQYRLVSIRNTSANWSREGRREHLHSHSFK
ncbi:MAG: hypothetical protein CSA33_06410 [Desulfobulbus propionicus]|nr:MAG: hypothetical protein CSA33_06410 [Desulfobulbus propionicus]